MATQLKTIYYKNGKDLIAFYNNKINIVLKSRISAQQKNKAIATLKYQFQVEFARLNTKYQADLLALLKPATPAIKRKKKALLIGINYNGQLQGCINDVNDIKAVLCNKYAFDLGNIRLLTDDAAIPIEQQPTRITILAAFTKLLKDGEAGDLLFFAYSGHGSYTLDRNNDDTGGYDEMIIPSDFKGILDDELKQLIQTYLKKNVTLFALFDSCFSGTVLDLKYQYLDSLDNNNFTENSNEAETTGNVIMISGCTDQQTSADAYIDKKYQGAMTWSFIATVNAQAAGGSITWRDLLLKMRNALKTSQFAQLPQLSSGCFMNINQSVCF